MKTAYNLPVRCNKTVLRWKCIAAGACIKKEEAGERRANSAQIHLRKGVVKIWANINKMENQKMIEKNKWKISFERIYTIGKTLAGLRKKIEGSNY